MLYREWQRPWGPALFGVALGGAFAGIPIGISVALGDAFNLAGGIIIPSTAAFVAFLALISARWIRLEPEMLRIGGKRIPLEAVTETRILRGREL
jgi:hypothetical protein